MGFFFYFFPFLVFILSSLIFYSLVLKQLNWYFHCACETHWGWMHKMWDVWCGQAGHKQAKLCPLSNWPPVLLSLDVVDPGWFPTSSYFIFNESFPLFFILHLVFVIYSYPVFSHCPLCSPTLEPQREIKKSWNGSQEHSFQVPYYLSYLSRRLSVTCMLSFPFYGVYLWFIPITLIFHPYPTPLWGDHFDLVFTLSIQYNKINNLSFTFPLSSIPPSLSSDSPSLTGILMSPHPLIWLPSINIHTLTLPMIPSPFTFVSPNPTFTLVTHSGIHLKSNSTQTSLSLNLHLLTMANFCCVL